MKDGKSSLMEQNSLYYYLTDVVIIDIQNLKNYVVPL